MPRPGSDRRPFTPTTTISVLRSDVVDDEDDPADGADAPATPEAIATGVPASIGQGRPREDRDGGSRQATVTRLVCDLTDLVHTDQVLDETTGITWSLDGVQADRRLGLDYLTADLTRTSGAL